MYVEVKNYYDNEWDEARGKISKSNPVMLVVIDNSGSYNNVKNVVAGKSIKFLMKFLIKDLGLPADMKIVDKR